MSKGEKFWLLIGPAITAFVYALTSPMVHVYFISLISAKVLAAANLLSLGLGAFVNLTVSVDRAKEMYRRNFVFIVLIDVICYVMFSFGGLENPAVRFIGFAVLNAVSTTLWTVVMRNAVNRVIEGDELTDWESLQKSVTLTAACLGGVLALLAPDIEIVICIGLQCIGNLILGLSDLKAFKMLAEKAFGGMGKPEEAPETNLEEGDSRWR